jgi:glycerol-3-phosphate dehydrogenase
VAGGKLTTYRLMAEQTLDQIVGALKFRAGACRTAVEPLLPPEQASSGILPPPFSRHAVEHCVMNEWALRLDDVMVRRTSWQQYLRDAGQKAEQVLDWMGELLGWSGAQRSDELLRYQRLAGPGGARKSASSTERNEQHIRAVA